MAPESDPGASPTVLDTLATTGGTPNARRVGNVINVPDPTTVLIVPAAMPESSRAAPSHGLTGREEPHPDQQEARRAALPAGRASAVSAVSVVWTGSLR